jgi:hypothetical protein
MQHVCLHCAGTASDDTRDQQRSLDHPRSALLLRGYGLIAGNVYLLAAAQGLAAWFHSCHRTDLACRLGLRPEPGVFFAPSIGQPDKG